MLIKSLLGWLGKDVEILQAQNIAFRLQYTKLSVLKLIPHLGQIQSGPYKILNLKSQ